MASQAKKAPLKNSIDLARAVAASLTAKEQFIRASMSGKGGYRYYRGFRAAAPMTLKVAAGMFLTAPAYTKAEAMAHAERECINAKGELENNLALVAGLYDYVMTHDVTGAENIVEPVSLGRAGLRHFWEPFILKIDGRKYIPFIDPRLPEKGLISDSRRLVFSIQNGHFRVSDQALWGDIDSVILQFDYAKNGTRKVIPHFNDGAGCWNDKQIAKMIDDTYRLLDDIRKAA
jgi:hypothetical protein